MWVNAGPPSATLGQPNPALGQSLTQSKMNTKMDHYSAVQSRNAAYVSRYCLLALQGSIFIPRGSVAQYRAPNDRSVKAVFMTSKLLQNMQSLMNNSA